MRNVLRALTAIVAAGIALVVAAPAANAIPLDNIVVAHRGATTSTVAEGTLPSYKYAVQQHADILDGDVRWTKDSSDADTVGTMIISHDATLDRVTNCSGYVSKWLWTSIRDKCRTSAATGSQRLIKLSELLAYAKSAGKPVALQIKLTSLTSAQASQFWRAVRTSRVTLEASSGQLPAMNKIKALDKADTTYKINYAFVTLGTDGHWPSASYVKSIGTSVHARLEIPATVMRSYQAAKIPVYLFTGQNEDDYRKMIALGPYGVVVDDVGRFQRWRDSITGT
jgi:glycerophosphoryl diester phosphodiesterase